MIHVKKKMIACGIVFWFWRGFVLGFGVVCTWFWRGLMFSFGVVSNLVLAWFLAWL